ncbi:MAG: SPFH domain-containing protein [Gammaproteobacteria bacterium]|nr:SPFH domain-containing protein [Gammaproteobacteria bacterium]
MAFWDRVKGELIDIIEWLDDSHDTMLYRFERHNNEIKYGAKLVVREGQAALFINEGQLEQPKPQTWNVMEFEAGGDVFEPGTYTLETKNMPIISTLQGWKHGFESPFKAEVYFVSTTRFTNQKWGTPNPIMLRDPEFGPIRLRAFGSYSLKIKDPARFLREIAGTDAHFTTDEIADQLRSMIIARFTDVLGESKIAALDLAASYDELGQQVAQRLSPEFMEYGLELTKLLIENISLPPAVTEALDKRSSMGVLGNMGEYTRYQTAEAIEKAAENPGGMAGAGMAMGAGFGMANQMAQAFQQPAPAYQPPQQAAPPPPPPPVAAYHIAVGGQSSGPFDMGALRQQMQSGALTRDTMVWKQGMPQWTAAGQVPELASLFGAMPPPLPPG